MSDKSFRDQNSPLPRAPVKQNWLTWIILGIIDGAPKTTGQRVAGSIAVAVSVIWLILMSGLWLLLFLKQGIFAALSASLGFFIWDIVPGLIVFVWVSSLMSKRRRGSWVNHPERRAADIAAAQTKISNMPATMARSRTIGAFIGGAICLIAFTSAMFQGANKDNASQHKDMHQFRQSPTVTVKRNPTVDYLDITSEDFYVYKPKSYTGDTPFGLIVYMSPNDDCKLPAGWADVLEKRHLLFVAPQAVGNGTYESRRNGMGIMSALAMMQEYKIDPARVYAAGLSGGARSADMMAFYQPDLFKGTIQDCGADFYKEVAHDHTTNWTDSLGKPYGVINDVLPADITAARENVRFVFITGSKDIRRGNLIDLYENGYKPNGFQSKLLDIPGMGREDCKAETLNKALDFIDEAKGEKPAA